MATRKRRGLGRGLDALLAPVPGAQGAATTAAGIPAMATLDQLQPGPYQPRTRMDEEALQELADSIRAQGIMQPILVREVAAGGKGRYEIIAGERRFRAARIAGLDTVPVLVREVPDEAAAAMALIENIQREDLNPLEEAQGLRRLVDEFGLTHEEAAQAVGRSRSAASNLLRLLQLTAPVQALLMAGDLEMGHARALLALPGAEQINAANQVSARRLSVRETEALVRRLSDPQGGKRSARKRARPAKSGDLRRVEEELSDMLLAPVEVRVRKYARDGKTIKAGELSVGFGSLDELNGIIERMRDSGG